MRVANNFLHPVTKSTITALTHQTETSAKNKQSLIDELSNNKFKQVKPVSTQ
jgi:hypothetical protein